MSAFSYEVEYQQALADLGELHHEDVHVAAAKLPTDPKKRNAFLLQFWVPIYARYLRLARRLAVIHQVELQPQKLHDVRTLLDSCLGRMLEAKRVLATYCGDFISLDNLMLDMKLTPDEMEAPIPRYLIDDRKEELKQRRIQILSIQAHYADTDPDAPISVVQSTASEQMRLDPTKALVPLPTKASAAAAVGGGGAAGEAGPAMSLEEAVHLLQVCERGRQARQRAKFQLAIYHQQRHATAHAQDYNTVTGKDRAATVVQRAVQGYLARKEAAKVHEEEKRFLGLCATEEILANTEQVAAQLHLQNRHAKQRMNVAELQRKTMEMESNLKAKEGPRTMEAMLDEILMRMAYARLQSKDGAPIDFPTPEEGGSAKLLSRLDKPEDGRQRNSSARPRSKSVEGGALGGSVAGDGTAGGVGPRKSTTGAGAAPAKEGGEADAAMEALTRSALWPMMLEGSDRYRSTWRDRFVQSYVEKGDVDQPGDEAILRQQLLEGPRGIMTELRKCVDQLVMMEVTNLKERMETEKNAKRKKKAKKERKPKKPKLKDTTKGVDLETSISTLVYENKLQLPPPDVHMASFVGPTNVMASPLDTALRARAVDEETKKKWQRIIKSWDEGVEAALRMKKEAFEKLFAEFLKQSSWLDEPSGGQIRRAVVEYGVLPLGSQVIHDLSPHDNTMLMYGFPATGKTLLAFAVCNESGSNFFNLSPANFTTTKGIAKVIQLVFYVARMRGPSVIYIDNVEKVFPSKKGGSKKDPLAVRGKKMKKELLKGLASVLPTDRILLIGTTTEPWLADSAAIATVFKRAVYLPLPDYAKRVTLLNTFVRLVAPDVTLSTGVVQQIALMTDGYSAGHLRSMVEKTLHPQRVLRLTRRPLEASDFVPAMSVMKAHTPAERELMRGFHTQLPFTLRRANAAEDFKESEEDAKKRKTASKGKGRS